VATTRDDIGQLGGRGAFKGAPVSLTSLNAETRKSWGNARRWVASGNTGCNARIRESESRGSTLWQTRDTLDTTRNVGTVFA